MTPFSSLLKGVTVAEDGWSVDVTPDWRQGRTLYGGLSAALCLEACLRSAADLPPLRSAQLAFVGPATEDLRLRTKLLRQGKSATFMTSDLTSAGQSATHATFCFGQPRPSAFSTRAAPAPAAPAPDACPDFFAADRRPAFAAHYEVRLAAGGPPFSGAAAADILLWVRHRDPLAPHNGVALLALADVPPPAAMSVFTAPAMISTMTWMIDFLDEAALSTGGWKLLRSKAQTIREGYSAQTMQIWGSDGAALADGRQTIAVFG